MIRSVQRLAISWTCRIECQCITFSAVTVTDSCTSSLILSCILCYLIAGVRLCIHIYGSVRWFVRGAGLCWFWGLCWFGPESLLCTREEPPDIGMVLGDDQHGQKHGAGQVDRRAGGRQKKGQYGQRGSCHDRGQADDASQSHNHKTDTCCLGGDLPLFSGYIAGARRRK